MIRVLTGPSFISLTKHFQDVCLTLCYYGLLCLLSRIVCRTKASGGEKVGHMSVKVSGGGFGLSSQTFSYQVL